ncbi:hypothetical protein RHGRI_018206 [Rhododendron griersonianum]|uniref:Transmembrane protein n=1 Tax=Rhododendron griersonianum TaxID=479676 RepID=A0AAV6K0J9_9ERIC|nr:hypothetical protein RHGRI_018206 [Rhododendron griersonianum]
MKAYAIALIACGSVAVGVIILWCLIIKVRRKKKRSTRPNATAQPVERDIERGREKGTVVFCDDGCWDCGGGGCCGDDGCCEMDVGIVVEAAAGIVVEAIVVVVVAVVAAALVVMDVVVDHVVLIEQDLKNLFKAFEQ